MDKHGDIWANEVAFKLLNALLEKDEMSCDDVDVIISMLDSGECLYQAIRRFYGDV